jgi:hypothetical protein
MDATKEDNKIYSSTAFYRMIGYMKANFLIKIDEVDKRDVNGYVRKIHRYSLTWKGSTLARILASFHDADPKLREEFSLIFKNPHIGKVKNNG